MSTRSTNTGIVTGSAKQTATATFVAHLIFLVATLLTVVLTTFHRLIAVDGGVMVLSGAALFVAWCLYEGVRQWLDDFADQVISIVHSAILRPLASMLKSSGNQAIRLWRFIETEAIGPYAGDSQDVTVIEAAQQRLGSFIRSISRTFGTPDPEIEDQDFS